MKICVTHATQLDFINKLYNPIKNSELYKNHEIFFPHDEVSKNINTKEIIKQCDLVLAEVSIPSVGQGIELGWADFVEKPILCIYQKGSSYSSALKFITNNFLEYENETDMVSKIQNFINGIN